MAEGDNRQECSEIKGVEDKVFTDSSFKEGGLAVPRKGDNFVTIEEDGGSSNKVADKESHFDLCGEEESGVGSSV